MEMAQYQYQFLYRPATSIFYSPCSTPYISVPSSPQLFGTGIGTAIGTGTGSGNFFYSAPASPTHTAVLYNQFKDYSPSTSANFSSLSSAIPFDWEEMPGTPKVSTSKSGKFDDGDDEYDFAFDFSGQLERPSLSADKLFDGGKIKPLKPPLRLQIIHGGFGDSESEINDFKTANSSPRLPMKKIFKEAFSPRRKRSDFSINADENEILPQKQQQQNCNRCLLQRILYGGRRHGRKEVCEERDTLGIEKLI